MKFIQVLSLFSSLSLATADQQSTCTPDASYICTSCIQNYFLSSPTGSVCVGACPTGYTLDSPSNTCLDPSTVPYFLFQSDFSTPTSVTANTIGGFSTPLANFQTAGGPVLTKDRGMYIPQGAYLTLDTRPIPSPLFAIIMWVRVLDPGVIFQITGDTQYLVIEVAATESSLSYFCSIRVCVSPSSCTLNTPTLYLPCGSTSAPANIDLMWRYLVIQVEQTSSNFFNINEYLDAVGYFGTVSAVNTIGLHSETFTWQIGDSSSGFGAFLYQITGSYPASYNNLAVVMPPLCNPYYYFEDGNCYSCGGTCSISPLWCVRGTDCSICYSNQCSSCTGFSADLCSANSCPSDCLECSDGSTCSICASGYMLMSYTYWGTFCFDNFKAHFMTNTIPSFLNSGADPTTYFQNSPESDDPIGYPCRGFYFDGTGMFFQAKVAVVFPKNLVIYMWAFPVSGDIVSKGTGFSVDCGICGNVAVMDASEETEIIQACISNPGEWSYFAFKISYSGFVTTLTSFDGTNYNYYTGIKNYYFQDNDGNILYIGKSANSNYLGFIASMGVLSVDADLGYSLTEALDLNFYCGVSLNNCPLNPTIMSTCSEACTSCDICYDAIYNNCFECPSGSYYFGDTCGSSCPGQVSYKASCYNIRGNCMLNAIGLACESCNSPYYLYYNICISHCPSSMTTDSVNLECMWSSSQVFSLVLDDIIELGSLNSFAFGSVTTNAYPTIDPNDPVPALGRGYYFTSNSYITSTSYFLGPDLSVTIWVKLIADTGVNDIFSKQLSGVNFLTLSRNTDTYFSLASDSGIHYYVKDSNQITMTDWNYIEIMIYFDEIYLTSRLSIVYNTACSDELTVSFDFWSDKPNSILVIGSNLGYGFNGFLYSVEAWSQANIYRDLYSTTCTGASPCPSSTITLGICAISESETSCSACLGTCTDGCVRTTDCNLCADVLCSYCSTFTAVCTTCIAGASLVGGSCQCSAGFFETATYTCQACDITCATCNGASASNCLSCTTNTLFTSINRCMPALACPTLPGLPASAIPGSNTCILQGSMVFYTSLVSLQNSFHDQISNILITTGADTSFYPNYAGSDPWVASGRGYYFNPSSYLSIDPVSPSQLVLGPEFAIGIWAFVVATGTLFSRSSTNTILLMTTAATGYLGEIATVSNVAYSGANPLTHNTWHLVELRLGSRDYGSLIVTAVDTGVFYSANIDYFADAIASVNTVVGSTSGGGFTGFVWSISIYNIWHSFTMNTYGVVVYPIESSSPLSTCLISQFSSTCAECLSSCRYGCNKATNCYLCTDALCSSCSDVNTCTACEAYAEIVAGACQCMSFFNTSLNACNPVINCYTNCGICSDTTPTGCSECVGGYYMVDGYCMRCPTGYSNSTGLCVLASDVIFSVTLDSLKGVLYDTYSMIPVITGASAAFYPNYDLDDPIATYLQGFYFNGYSSVLRLPQFGAYTEPELILGPSWTLGLWLMPVSDSGCLAFSSSLNGTLFAFYYNGTNFFASLNLTETPLNVISFPFSLTLNTWQVLTISLSFGVPNHLYVYVNNLVRGNTVLQGTVFPNYCNVTTYSFGGNSTVFYEGFMYEIAVYTSAKIPTRMLQDSACAAAYNGRCLPECKITQFWEGPGLTNCSECTFGCSSCRRNDTCNLCLDPFCDECNDFNSTYCSQCTDNATFQEQCTCVNGNVYDYTSFSCVTCRENQYYNEFTCIDCPDLCQACDAATCFSCIANAGLIGNWCSCQPGYNGSNCDPAYFTSSLDITTDNSAFLTFSDDLFTYLQPSDLLLSTNSTSNPSFTMLTITHSRYYLTLSFSSTIPAYSQLLITFVNAKNMVSVYNSLLNTSVVTGMLYSSATITPNIMVTEQAEGVSNTTTVVLTSVTVATAMINPNPACLWSFISTIQMLCFISMSSVELTPRFKGYLKGLRKFNMFPNIFTYFMPHYGGQKPFEKAYEFGYTDDLILFNSGSYLSAFLSMIFIWLIFYIMSKLTNIKPFSLGFVKKKIESTLSNYKYGAFVRFWITCYIDVFAAALIVFSTTSIFIWTAIVNYVFGVIIAV